MTSINTISSTQGQTQEVIAISQHEHVIDAARLMYENRIGSLVVVKADDDETMVGIITERDILRWISNATPQTYFQEVHKIMTREVVSSQPGAPLSDSIAMMDKYQIRHMPTVVGGKAIGMLSVRDLLERRVL